jgi:hypothetical protein
LNAHRLEKTIISLVALHSFILGSAMLFFPTRTLQMFRWDYHGDLFFPAQTGIFLILFAIAYVAVLWHRELVWYIIVTKIAAVAFLLGAFIILGDEAPRVILITALLDGTMGAAVTATMTWRKRVDNCLMATIEGQNIRAR